MITNSIGKFYEDGQTYDLDVVEGFQWKRSYKILKS